MMKKVFWTPFLLLLVSCHKPEAEKDELNRLAVEYVKLGLTIGQYDGDFVDAYYGPDSLKPATAKDTAFPKDSILRQISFLKDSFQKIAEVTKNDTIRKRAVWMGHQLTAFSRRVRNYSGEYQNFDTESHELFDAVAPRHTENHFKLLIDTLDQALPGKGTVVSRFRSLADRFRIPPDKIDTVFKTAIAEARRRTIAHYPLPVGESFELEYVRDKPWSGYNWYKGNYKSTIQINISQPIFIDRAIDLACHEGYPGHHVYNMLLEKNLFRNKGWMEISLYPLFSPQSLIAEGSANYGISVAFPGNEQAAFCKGILMPLAGIDTAWADRYFKALALKSQLDYARNEVARGLLSSQMSAKEAERWLAEYCLLTPEGVQTYMRFIKKYRSYVINYNYGQELIKNYIESNGGTESNPGLRWKLFEILLSNEIKASDLIKK
ncbi:hypothetical protein [Dyadobacter helix]|nr:hypothetical protein [Dyadobacter sp. CECT 9275]